MDPGRRARPRAALLRVHVLQRRVAGVLRRPGETGDAGGAAAPQSFGKYGLESVALLLRAWPEDADLPGDVLDLCGERGDSVHADVAEVLSRSHRVRDAVILPPPAARTETRINGVSEVVPVSFLEDLGDDGYVEDY